MNTIVAIALSCLLLISGDNKNKKDYFANVISTSRYVAVVPLQGKDITRQSQEDLQAQADIETALRKWKRFVVVSNPAAADLIIAFRRGNVASVKVGPVYREDWGRGDGECRLGNGFVRGLQCAQ
ncbi:MAG: hypothetical protein JWO13_694 [Acidobacteriales bacterium]|nr:hypothetical protein [Terriglobales bacterium]